MKTALKLVFVTALALAVAGTVALKKGKSPAETTPAPPSLAATATLPRMVDLGAGKCIPCRLMKPVLDELKRDFADRFVTEFIDVWENPDAGEPYGIEMIPTQIFYNAEGKELFRHAGFYGKEDILGKWKELGVDPNPARNLQRNEANKSNRANHEE